MRFVHAADLHLGCQQYGSKERFNDFSRVFLHIVDQAVEQQVGFVLLAGDLFDKHIVDPLAMRVAMEGLRRLQEAGISVLAVEGNHDRAHYRDQYSWVDFLDGLGYLYLLNPRFENGRAILEPYGDDGGAYVDLPLASTSQKGVCVRVYGIKYYGASTSKVFGLFADTLAKMNHDQVDVCILLSHAGLEWQLPHCSGTLTHNDLAPLREHIDYLALGHTHKPCAVDGWIYNPGSPETWSMEEVAWPERGYYLVEIQPGGDPVHRVDLVVPPRRPFCRLRLEVDALTEPNAVYDAVRRLIRREDGNVPRDPAPVVELTLGGILPFDRIDLDLGHIQELLDNSWSPLVTHVRDMGISVEPEKESRALRLEDIRPGKEESKAYARCVFDVLSRCFANQLSYPECESRTVDGTERRDIVFFNISSHEFWRMVNRHHAATHIVFECKNSEKLRLEHVNQLVGYLGRPLGNFGIIVSRLPPEENLRRKAITALNRHGKVVLFLSDQDLNEMERLTSKGIDPAKVIERKYVKLTRAVQ